MIKKVLKELMWMLLRFTGIPLIMREVVFKNKAAIIVYHDPKPETFEKHIKYLSKYYNFMTLNRLVDAIHNKDWSTIPPKSLVLTIDDGHIGNYELLNILKKYHIYPMMYFCSHIVNTNRHFWWKTGHPDNQILKKSPHEMMLKSLLEEVSYWPNKDYSERQALNTEEVREMSPYVDFQSHTRYHPILTNCINVRCLDEIKNSKTSLEELLDKSIEHFSYPHGNYGEREIEYVKKCGYRSARTGDWGFNSLNSNLFKLKVIVINEEASVNKLCAQMSGCFRFLQVLYGNGK